MAARTSLINVTSSDVVMAAQAVFTFRKASVTDPVVEHRHPMLYKDKSWTDLPVSEKVYYCDMVITAFNQIGIGVPDAPVFASLVA